MTTHRILVVAAALLVLLAVALWLAPHKAPRALLADPVLTPGVLNGAVTQATIGATICRRGWTSTIRPPSEYTSALKRKQLRQYHETGPPSGYQEDHLISLELGGDPLDPGNLWPEPYPRASAVDRIENELNAQVCSGALSLRDAQLKESVLKHDYG